jgi:proteasome lid subunit RPN8/RPN11
MENIDHSPEHFSFAPKDQFAALRYARSKGLKILANWHSHPASPSRPSQEDLRLANDPTIRYAILSPRRHPPELLQNPERRSHRQGSTPIRVERYGQ